MVVFTDEVMVWMIRVWWPISARLSLQFCAYKSYNTLCPCRNPVVTIDEDEGRFYTEGGSSGGSGGKSGGRGGGWRPKISSNCEIISPKDGPDPPVLIIVGLTLIVGLNVMVFVGLNVMLFVAVFVTEVLCTCLPPPPPPPPRRRRPPPLLQFAKEKREPLGFSSHANTYRLVLAEGSTSL